MLAFRHSFISIIRFNRSTSTSSRIQQQLSQTCQMTQQHQWHHAAGQPHNRKIQYGNVWLFEAKLLKRGGGGKHGRDNDIKKQPKA